MLFDFRCDKTDKVFERWVPSDTKRVQCRCGSEAQRLISPVKSVLDPLSGHFPGATMKWAKAHEDGAKQSS